jgi:putative methyltransferase (TIGR04325 family)
MLFLGNVSTWEGAVTLCTGYDAEVILEKALGATLKVKFGEVAYERDSVLFDKIQYSWPVTAALMWSAAKNGGELHVLDFGGSLGTSYFQNRKFLSSLKSISWSVVEQEHFVGAGRNYIEDEIIKFYLSIDEFLETKHPSLILLSSVAQYLPDLDDFFRKINAINASVLVFDRTPFFSGLEHKVCIQRVSQRIYDASYPMWILSKSKLIHHLDKWSLIESFACPEGRFKLENGDEFEFSGLIFERHDA